MRVTFLEATGVMVSWNDVTVSFAEMTGGFARYWRQTGSLNHSNRLYFECLRT